MLMVLLTDQFQSLDGISRLVGVEVGHSAEVESFVAFGVEVEVLLEEGQCCWKIVLVVVGLFSFLEDAVTVGRGVQGLAVFEGF